MAISMLRGLAFLHEERIDSDGVYKPTIAHRDFKSRNVLLKQDLTACIADFGLSIKCEHDQTPNDTRGQVNLVLSTAKYTPLIHYCVNDFGTSAVDAKASRISGMRRI